ncbi:MAG: hypothetical protein K8R90_01465 [Candidatus Cloacimonetes bacterium]|nr:hypothetical protein [Candidatus Cloacimonadota bacterium]
MVVVDTCSFSTVFKTTNKEHEKYSLIYAKIIDGSLSLIVGGSVFMENERMRAHINSLKADNDKMSIIRIINEDVDKEQKEVEKRAEQNGIPLTDKKLNDQHIIALVICSWCQLVCARDKKQPEYLQNRVLYPVSYPQVLPRVYDENRHEELIACANLVNEDNVV